MRTLTDKQIELLEDSPSQADPDAVVEHLRQYLATDKEPPNKLKNEECRTKDTGEVKVKSILLDILEEADWNIDNVLSSKHNRTLAIVELAEMEGYIKGLTELNQTLVNIIKEE